MRYILGPIAALVIIFSPMVAHANEETSEQVILAYELMESPSTIDYGTELFIEARTEMARYVGGIIDVPAREIETAWKAASIENQVAIMSAVGQVGKPYRYASSSPERGFDCSGLTMYAWAQVDIQLPPNSRAQINSVNNDIMPMAGDIVYYPGHVSLYLGVGDHIVHAANRRSGVTFGHIRRNVRFGHPDNP